MIPSVITNSILASAPDLTGPSWLLFADVVGDAVAAWAATPGAVVIQGVTNGTAGSGVVSGSLVVTMNPIDAQAAFYAAGVQGVLSNRMALACTTGVAVAMSAPYTGVSVGVGLGTDVSAVVVADVVTLTTLFVTSASARGMTGVNVPILSVAVGSALSSMLLGSVGTGVVTGASGPSAAVGTSTSSVV